jgi:HEAT repeat protein
MFAKECIELSSSPSREIAQAVDRMKSLHDGDRGFAEVVGLGNRTIPLLRKLLLSRERSGLHYTRCRAADALATLKVYDVLEEFLRLERKIDDPVERLGEDAVINSAARGIARSHAEWAFRLLLDLASRRLLSGLISGLGSFKRREAIPQLIGALAEDDVRMTAEAALRQIGNPAKAQLIAAASSHETDREIESESDLRKRRSALVLLGDIGISRKEWTALKPLMRDKDRQIAFLTCRLCLRAGDRIERSYAIARFAELRGGAHWLERLEIDRYLQDFSGPRGR